MATFAIGDVQGCYDTLMRLLERIDFDEVRDSLWFAGDLVNRGPHSLATLRFVRGLGDRAVVVLGNHDLHLLAVRHAGRSEKQGDTLRQVLEADDCDELLDWLRHLPFVHRDDELGTIMSHAGFPHIWSLEKAAALAGEVEQALQGDDFRRFLGAMYGNDPPAWSEQLVGLPRLRVVTNYLVRMRVVDVRGALDLEFNGGIEDVPRGYFPWFQPYCRRPPPLDILFGHWAALGGRVNVPRVAALDTGCVWGNGLLALNIGTAERVLQPSVK